MKLKTQNSKLKTTMQKSKVFSFYSVRKPRVSTRGKISGVQAGFKAPCELSNGVYLWFCFFIFYFLLFLSGCATVLEGTKGFIGISTKSLEDNRPYALKQTFNYDYNTCYSKVEETLKNIGAYIYAKNTQKNMLAVYVSSEDTTPVGIFFKAVDTANTQIEVSSPSTSAKELIAKIMFKALGPEKEKGGEE